MVDFISKNNIRINYKCVCNNNTFIKKIKNIILKVQKTINMLVNYKKV